MADLPELYQQLAFLQGGGGQETSLDKINKIFGTVNTGIGNVYTIKKMQQEAILNALKAKEAQAKIDESRKIFPMEVPASPEEIAANMPAYSKAMAAYQSEKQSRDEARQRLINRSANIAPSGPPDINVPSQQYGRPAPNIMPGPNLPGVAPSPAIPEQNFQELGLGNQPEPSAPSRTKTQMLSPEEYAKVTAAEATRKKAGKENLPLSLQDAYLTGYATPEQIKAVIPGWQPGNHVAIGMLNNLLGTDRAMNLQVQAAKLREAAENRAKYKEEFDKLSNIKSSISSMESLLNRVPEGLGGAGESLVGKSGQAFPEAATYDGNVKALAVNVYRATTGDTRLSDADAAVRALPILPRTWDADPIRQAKWAYIKSRIDFRNYQLENGIPEVPWGTSGFSKNKANIKTKTLSNYLSDPKIPTALKNMARRAKALGSSDDEITSALENELGRQNGGP